MAFTTYTFTLNYGKFEEYFIERRPMPDMYGVQYIFKFPNNYGASVIKHKHSIGYEKDMWEVGVTRWYTDGSSNLVYDTPVASDVIGYCTDEDAQRILETIMNLP